MGDNTTSRMDPFNEPQPDVVLRLDPTAGGRSRVSSDDYLEGAPELIVEVAASSATYDLREKKTVYQRNGVQEYIVWQIFERRLDWFYFYEDEYEPLRPDADGVIHSQIFPGLNLNVRALLDGNLAQVLTTVQAGIQTTEHTAFVERLRTDSSPN
jgi:Uma2 family endonuclease